MLRRLRFGLGPVSLSMVATKLASCRIDSLWFWKTHEKAGLLTSCRCQCGEGKIRRQRSHQNQPCTQPCQESVTPPRDMQTKVLDLIGA